MTCRLSLLGSDRRGVAAVEFALIAPMLLLLLGGVVDFGLIMSGRSKLANAVAQAVQTALLTGPSVTQATLRSVVQTGATNSGLTPTVTVTGSPACYCVSGSPAALSSTSTALSAQNTCTGTCPTGSTGPAVYVVVAASYVYSPLMPLYSQLSSPVISQTGTVRLQ